MWQVIFQTIPVVAWLVALGVVVLPLGLSRRYAVLLSLVLAAAFSKFAINTFVGGNIFNPDLPYGVIWFCGWAYGSAMLLTAASFVAVVFDGIMRMCRRPVILKAKRVRAAVLAVFAVALATWGIYESVRTPDVRDVEIGWKDLPPGFDGYRIVHLTDLHCSSASRRVRFERIAEEVNKLNPDLVVLTGDFVDGHVADRKGDLAPLADIRAKDGLLGCTGNHEKYWDWPGWSKVMRSWGIVFPEEDGAFVIRRGNDAIAVGGLTDPVFFRKKPQHYGDAARAFTGAPENAFRILLYHRPFVNATGAAAANVKLQLSGHTHGGAMPILRQLVERVNEGHVRGLYMFAPGQYLYLSPGSGQWAGFPLRILTPAEITKITFRRK